MFQGALQIGWVIRCFDFASDVDEALVAFRVRRFGGRAFSFGRLIRFPSYDGWDS